MTSEINPGGFRGPPRIHTGGELSGITGLDFLPDDIELEERDRAVLMTGNGSELGPAHPYQIDPLTEFFDAVRSPLLLSPEGRKTAKQRGLRQC